jgi:hypothetical protein
MPVGYPLPPIPLGTRYGRLVVTGHVGTNDHGHPRVTASCDCGQARVVLAGNLRHGGTRSCGCVRKAVARASMTKLHTKRRFAANSA